MTRYGVPARVIDITLAMYLAAKNGEFAAVNTGLAALIGREPVTVRQLLKK